jgi:glycosyltransferase involved in cell wall biosynthesis
MKKSEQQSMVATLKRIDNLVDKVEDWSRLPVEPLVSVYMITYNHEKFIAQALDGILMQEVDFPYEIVIGEDKSTDRTRAVVCEYQRRHPDKIRLHLSRENLFRQKLAGLGPLAACRGKYIAMCEGDDYWTDPQKLQKQVAVLEAEPEVSFCFHDVLVVQDGGGGQYPFYTDLPQRTGQHPRPPGRIELKDILPKNFIATGSVMARQSSMLPLPSWIAELPAGDWGLFIHLLHSGCGVYLDQIMGVYRLHPGSMWSSRDPLDIHALWIRELRVVMQSLGEPHRTEMQCRKSESIERFIRVAAGALRRTYQRHGHIAAKKQARKLSDLADNKRIKPKSLLFAAYEQLFLHASNAGNRRDALSAYWQCLRVRPVFLFDRHALRRLQRLVLRVP